VDHGYGGGVEEVEGEITIAGDIHAVAGDAVEAEIPAMASRSKGKPLPARAPERAGECWRGGAPLRSAPNRAGTFRSRRAGNAARARLGPGACGCIRDDGAGVHLREAEQMAITAQSSACRSAHCSRSHMRVSSDTCSLRLRPVWILSATLPARSLSLRITSVCTSSSLAPE